jgi:hypothetical protein
LKKYLAREVPFLAMVRRALASEVETVGRRFARKMA